MKLLLPIVCSLLLIGCSDSTTSEAPIASQNEVQASSASDTGPAEANVQTEAPIAVETPKEAPEPADTSKPEKALAPAPKPTAAAKTAINPGAIFAQKCASCHGANAEKSALGKSQIIADFSEQQIKDALHGYQNGTYGKEMKALMQGQAKPLSSEQIDALAHYISDL